MATGDHLRRHRWSGGTIYGSRTWSGGTIHSNLICHRWSRGPILGGPSVACQASFFLAKTSIPTVSRLQIDLSLFYPNVENDEIRYDLFGETRTNV